MAKFTLDLSGRGGLAPKFYGDVGRTVSQPHMRAIGADNQMAEGFYNPFIFHGYLTPTHSGFKTLTFNTTHSNLLGSCVYDDINEDTYFAERGTQIFTGSSGLDDTSFIASLDLANATFTDLEIYMVNGVRKLFYSFKSSGTPNIGIATLPFAANDDDWLSTAPTGAFTLTAGNNYQMRKADNGFMYVLDGNAVHKIDGTAAGGANGTVTANVLLFPTFFQLIDAVDYRGAMYMALYQTTKAAVNETTGSALGGNFTTDMGVYVWDRQSTQVRMTDYIPITGARQIKKIYISPNGTLRVIVVASNRMVQVREFDGSKFRIIQELGIGAYPNVPDGLTISTNAAFWIGNDGTLYAHGSPFPNEPEGIFKLASIVATSATDPEATIVGGALMYGTGALLSGQTSGFRPDLEGFFIGYNDSSATKFFKKWHFNNIDSGTIDSVTQACAQGDVYTLVKKLPALSLVRDILIHCLPTPGTGATTAGTVKIYFNNSSTAAMTKTITRDMASRGYVHIEVNKPFVHALQIEIEFSTSVNGGANSLLPSFAEVNYDPTPIAR